MTARSPTAFFVSVVLHGVVFAIVLFFTYAVHREDKPAPKIFELVAGEGDNFAATEAPALGEPGVKLEIPDIPAPAPEPVQPKVAPAPEPPAPTPPEPPVVTKAPPVPESTAAPTPPSPNFKQAIRKQVILADSKAKLQAARERRAEQKRQAAEQKRLAEERKREAAEQKRMTQEEFLRQQAKTKKPKTTTARTASPKYTKIDAEGIAEGVRGGSTRNKIGGADGNALVAEGPVLDKYFALLKQRVLWALKKDMPAGLSDTLIVTIQVAIAADGTLSRARVARSSGSEEFDRAVIAAFGAVQMPAHPYNRGEQLEMKFQTKDVEG